MKPILLLSFCLLMLSAFGQSRIDSNSYKRIHYLDYAQVTQDVFLSLDNDTIFGQKGKLLHIDTIYYTFKFEPYPDELKKKIIKAEFLIYLLNETNDTLYKAFNECSDSVVISIPISKKNKESKLVVIEKTTIRKKAINSIVKPIANKILSLNITNTINLNLRYFMIPRGYYRYKSRDNENCNLMLNDFPIYAIPINDLIIKTVPGVN